MKRSAILFIGFLLFGTTLADAQIWRLRRYEAMGGIGTSHYFGDIGGFSNGKNLLGFADFKFLQTRPSFYLGARYKLYQDWAVKLNLTYGYLRSIDRGGVNEDRGYFFLSRVFESSVQGEYYFIKEKMSNNYLMMKGRGITDFVSNISMYGFTGLGGVFFSPSPSQEVIDRMENEGNGDYGKVALVLPVGIGIKFSLVPQSSLSLELGGRITTTDFIDGLTTKYSKFNDVYYFGVVSYVYKIKTNRKGWPTFRN